MNRKFWHGKRVFISGHTGFKGGWLSLWLTDAGASVYGYALDPPTEPNFFDTCKLRDCLASHTVADVRDRDALLRAIQAAEPDIVLHLAAQPLVRQSYREPVETYAVNVMGTVNLLDAIRQTGGTRTVVNVTTDKCYENREWHWPYRERDVLGGHDPYSSSKACSELVTASYRSAFLASADIAVASARAGNVIGGGDWAADRLVPDFLRAVDDGRPLIIRSPRATRPWQHVLEPLSGYLMLAERLHGDKEKWSEAWNFGPDEYDIMTVEWLVDHLCRLMPGSSWERDKQAHPHEAHDLRLDSSRARQLLGWQPRWRIDRALEQTVAWHQAFGNGDNMAAFSLAQIGEYEQAGSA